jgi:hypothetical protein
LDRIVSCQRHQAQNTEIRCHDRPSDAPANTPTDEAAKSLLEMAILDSTALAMPTDRAPVTNLSMHEVLEAGLHGVMTRHGDYLWNPHSSTKYNRTVVACCHDSSPGQVMSGIAITEDHVTGFCCLQMLWHDQRPIPWSEGVLLHINQYCGAQMDVEFAILPTEGKLTCPRQCTEPVLRLILLLLQNMQYCVGVGTELVSADHRGIGNVGKDWRTKDGKTVLSRAEPGLNINGQSAVTLRGIQCRHWTAARGTCGGCSPSKAPLAVRSSVA